MRIAIIDCGTNTFHLLVADASKDGWKPIFEHKLPVKLGAAGLENNTIPSSRLIRGMDALYCHSLNIHNFEVEKTFAFATSAIREAENGNTWVEQVKKRLHILIKVIDGNEEAALIYKGVRQAVKLESTPSLIMDIGGGSVEFIIANRDEIVWKKSYPIGVSRLYSKIQPSEQMTFTEIQSMQQLLDEVLSDCKEAIKKYNCRQLIGSSGSFDTFFALHRYFQQEKNGSNETTANHEIPLKSFHTIYTWLLHSSLKDRLTHSVIPTVRAEYMPIAALLVQYILDAHPIEKMLHSVFSLKEGAIQSLIEKMDSTESAISKEQPEDYLEE